MGRLHAGKWAVAMFVASLGAGAAVNYTQLFNGLIERTSAGLRLKSLCGTPGFAKCDEFLPELRKKVKDRIEKHVDAAYAGKHLNPFGTDQNPYMTATSMQTPICNLARKAGAEQSKNALDQACGSVCRFACAGDPARGLKCSLTDVATCAAERAYLRGAFLQLVWSKYDEVMDELDREKKLTASPRCDAPPNDPSFKSLSQELGAAFNEWSETQGEKTPDCPADLSGGEASKQGGCYLKAAAKSLETLIMQLSVCEVFARAEQEWQGEREDFERVPEAAGAAAVTAAECASVRGDARKLEQCVNAQYATRMPAAFKSQMASFADAPKDRAK